MELIEREALLNKLPNCDFEKDENISKCGAIADMVMLVCDAPRIDAVPVVHGKWKNNGSTYECSRCSALLPYTNPGKGYMTGWFTPYCPNCGARMDEVQEVQE